MHALYDHKVAIKTRFKPNGENFFIWQNLKFEKKRLYNVHVQI